MFALDRAFAHRVEGWRRARKGYQVEILQGSRDMTRDISVKIFPVGLSKIDYVFCRFDKHGEVWSPYKGYVSSEHSAKEVAGFAFDGSSATSESCPLELAIKARYDTEKLKTILARDFIYNCEHA
jgi:hypothetical protein